MSAIRLQDYTEDTGFRLSSPNCSFAELIRFRAPFDAPEHLRAEADGFGALAHITPDGCRLISAHGNVYKSFGSLASSLRSLNCEAILDSGIGCSMATAGPNSTNCSVGEVSRRSTRSTA